MGFPIGVGVMASFETGLLPFMQVDKLHINTVSNQMTLLSVTRDSPRKPIYPVPYMYNPFRSLLKHWNSGKTYPSPESKQVLLAMTSVL